MADTHEVFAAPLGNRSDASFANHGFPFLQQLPGELLANAWLALSDLRGRGALKRAARFGRISTRSERD